MAITDLTDTEKHDHIKLITDNAQRVFLWKYDREREQLVTLYNKGMASQWNSVTDLDWSIEVDPVDTGGLASYLPMIAAESFERFNDAEKAEAGRQFNAWITSQFLHGEQGALLATSKLVREVPWTEAKFYGATQVADEARHVDVHCDAIPTAATARPGQCREDHGEAGDCPAESLRSSRVLRGILGPFPMSHFRHPFRIRSLGRQVLGHQVLLSGGSRPA